MPTTLVQNAETLAPLALSARLGPAWFRSVGPAGEPGSMLATVWQANGGPRVTEVPLGVPLTSLAGPLKPDDAVLIGGYHGTWLTGAEASGLTLDNRSLAAPGAPARPWLSSPCCLLTGAAWLRLPGWSATWRWKVPGSAARA